MIRSIKVRLEPNNKQRTKLFGSAGVARWAYNWTLEQQENNKKSGGKFIKDGDLRKKLTALKQNDPNYKWLYDYSNNITKQAIKDACKAYKDFFKGKTKKPRFKSKKRSKPSFYQDTEKIKFSDTHMYIEKVGWVRLSERGKIPTNTKYYNPRITFDGVHWYVSVGYDVPKPSVALNSHTLGIDVGIKDLAVCSDGRVFPNINRTKEIKKLEKRLRRLQRKCSRKYEMNKMQEKGGAVRYVKTRNITKLERQMQKIQIRLEHKRMDYENQVVNELVRTKPSRIVMEHLNIRGMMKNRHLSKAIQQQRLYTLKQKIKHKCEWFGIEFVEADRWYPSTKMCHSCGHIQPKIKLSDRVFRCDHCGMEMDRDLNASINLSTYPA
ncbi:RNA-guided endonuclease InsQ/TnpB family protein [Anoxybacillus ayderensis]|uniref:RNA-guided endonuclease InsQ/TnpB family protein n=1 Tax=Anoxybacillus ayderensis TaxID=265546 RepID=UPI000A26FBE9|nr:RNA-guided endonuclease TnpB family protein [Anoxybacillus ayderensis]OSX53156.1 transposase [Anoxybacillus ayderensis]